MKYQFSDAVDMQVTAPDGRQTIVKAFCTLDARLQAASLLELDWQDAMRARVGIRQEDLARLS